CVAHAIYNSRIPVVSAVGHEIDLTIADLVADCRALTPSEAAERIVPNCQELHDAVRGFEERLRALVMHRLQVARNRLEETVQRRCFRWPLEPIRDRERRVDEWNERLQRAIKDRLVRVREHLQAHAGRLEGLSPLNVLGRGYSLTRRERDLAVVRQ